MLKQYYLAKSLLPKKVFKYFIGYKDDEKVKPLSIMLPKISGYTKSSDGIKYMSFLETNDKIIK